MKKVAITGGIGSGKSTILKILRDEGYVTFSCDEIYKELIFDELYIKTIALHFPEAVENNTINKQKLAELVFSCNEKRRLLDSIAHPLIMERLEEKILQSKSNIVFAEVPLLFEGGYHTKFDEIIVAKREKKDRVRAVLQRDKTDEKSVLSKMDAQFNYDSYEGELFLKNIDAKILYNNQSIENLKKQLMIFINELM